MDSGETSGLLGTEWPGYVQRYRDVATSRHGYLWEKLQASGMTLTLTFKVVHLAEELTGHAPAVHKPAPLLQGRAQRLHLGGQPSHVPEHLLAQRKLRL